MSSSTNLEFLENFMTLMEYCSQKNLKYSLATRIITRFPIDTRQFQNSIYVREQDMNNSVTMYLRDDQTRRETRRSLEFKRRQVAKFNLLLAQKQLATFKIDCFINEKVYESLLTIVEENTQATHVITPEEVVKACSIDSTGKVTLPSPTNNPK